VVRKGATRKFHVFILFNSSLKQQAGEVEETLSRKSVKINSSGSFNKAFDCSDCWTEKMASSVYNIEKIGKNFKPNNRKSVSNVLMSQPW
jgi:hypothetical protein